MNVLQAGAIFASGLGLLIGVLSLAVARRERRRGSPAWAWVLPGAAGVILILWGLIRLWWVVA